MLDAIARGDQTWRGGKARRNKDFHAVDRFRARGLQFAQGMIREAVFKPAE